MKHAIRTIVLLALMIVMCATFVGVAYAAPLSQDAVPIDPSAQPALPMDPTIGGVSLIMLVMGYVELVKRFGVKGNTLMLVALIISVVVGFIYKLMTMFPQLNPWVETVIFCLAFGLASTGLFDMGNNAVKKAISAFMTGKE
jgi:hypothetical protein